MAIYLDNAASTPIDSEVLDAIVTTLRTTGNPSSSHTYGRRAHEVIAAATATVQAIAEAPGWSVLFTSGGTESNALAILGTGRRRPSGAVITTATEHASVLQNVRRLAECGQRVVILPVDRFGSLDPQLLEDTVDKRTALVTLSYANNEIGTIPPLESLIEGVRAHAPRCAIHLDASQTIGKLPLSVDRLGIDLVTISAHKFHGPKGVGALLCRPGFEPAALWAGGDQFGGLRPGTENLPAIAGLTVALEIAHEQMATTVSRLTRLHAWLEDTLVERLPRIEINGRDREGSSPVERLCTISSLWFPELPGEPLLNALDSRGVAVSSGSACHASRQEQSHVMTAIGRRPGSGAALRISTSRLTSGSDVQKATDLIVDSARDIARLYAVKGW